MITFLQYVGKAEQVQEVVFWMMSSLGRSSWDKVWIVSAVICICFTGTIGFIGFIGLVSPHITRMVIGGETHRLLLPASTLVGTLPLLGADTIARTILASVILPVGIMTAFIGVPLFIYHFLRRKKEFW